MIHALNWFRRLASTLRGQELEKRLDAELRFHLEMRTRENTAAGAGPEQAREEAVRRFGSVTRTKEACRDMDTFAWIGNTRQDIRYARRALGNAPGFTAAVLLCLSAGIAANTTVFSFVNAFLLRPLPVEHPEQIVMVGRGPGEAVSYPEYLDWKNLNGVFSNIAAWSPERLTIGQGASGDTAPGDILPAQTVLAEVVTGGYFETVGVRPLLGQLIAEGDDDQPLAVIGQDLWNSRFAGDRNICGRAILVNHAVFTVAGVVPRSFPGMLAPWTTGMWVTAALHRDWMHDRSMGWLAMTAARLKQGVTPGQAQAAMTGLDSEILRLHPAPDGRKPARLVVRQSAALASSPIWGVLLGAAALLMAVAAVVFFVACANVAGLLTSRYLVRRREIAIRLSLGASRGRLIRQLLTETALLGMMGCAAGTGLALLSGETLAAMLPASITGGFKVEHGMDWHVLLFTLGLSSLSVLLCGLLPALRCSNRSFAHPSGFQTRSGRESPRLRRLSIVIQVALSVLVLVTAGLFVRNVQKSREIDLGFEPAHLLSVALDLRDLSLTPQRRSGLYRQAARRVAGIPGVTAVTLSDTFPLGNTQRTTSVITGGLPAIETASSAVDSRYFDTMGIRFAKGRAFLAGERNAVIVNEAAARQFWHNREPVGKTIRPGRDGVPQSVVGVAKNSVYWSLDGQARPFVYSLSEEPAGPFVYLSIRTMAPAETLAASARVALLMVDKDLPVSDIRTANERIGKWLEPERAAARVFSILGLLALALAISGVYGLLAQLVTQRTPEIAVRVTLGATRQNVVALVLRQTASMVTAGLALGILASAALTRVFASLIQHVSPTDLLTFTGVCVVVILTGVAATLLPASRALRIEPATVLRAE